MIEATGPENDQPPPYSNRGVILESAPSDGPSFDCYNATVYADRTLCIGRLLEALTDAGHEVSVSDGPPVRFYAQNTLLTGADGRRLLSVRSGGQNPHPFVEAKGAVSPVVADTLRAHFDHAPARIDSAYDLRGPNVWGELCAIADQFEHDRGLTLNEAGARRQNRDRGTTIYLGSRKSQSFVRIYQKGLQIAEEMGLAGDAIPDSLRDWVRVELELKPDKRPARDLAARLAPADLWRCSPWTLDFARRVLSIDAEKIKMSEKRESNEERAMRYLVEQYGPTMLKRIARIGWAPFVDDLEDRLCRFDQEAMERSQVNADLVPIGT